MAHPEHRSLLASLVGPRSLARRPSLGRLPWVVLEAKVLLEGPLQEAWIPWGPGTARGTLFSIGPTVTPGPVVSAELIDGGDDAGPITRWSLGEHASPWNPPLVLFAFYIMERAAHDAVIS